jgi:hypothetical protein|tara:strand:- start:3472 stop:3879 length:408 start_codon:yes stop_codon:yes gene_type:complete
MKFTTLQGRTKRVSRVRKYLIDWEAKSRSNIQYDTKSFLKNYWLNNVVFEEFPVAGTRLTLDFYNATKKIAIEVQGQQHRKFVPFFHGNRMNYIDQLRRDKQKLEFCDINEIDLIEIYESDITNKSLLKKFKKYL